MPIPVPAEEGLIGAILLAGDALGMARRVGLRGDDFALPTLATVYYAACDIIDRGEAVDAVSIAVELDRQGELERVGGYERLRALAEACVSHHNARTYAKAVIEGARKRALHVASTDLAERALNGVPADDAIAAAIQTLDAIRDRMPKQTERAPHVDEWLWTDDPEWDWVVPLLIERGDRVILTGLEGMGKSTLMRQIGLQLAAGIHPFTLESIAPQRVLYLDFENSERFLKRQVRPLRIKAGSKLESERLVIDPHPEGIDLTRPTEAGWFEARVAEHKPDLLIAGPLYKMASGDPKEEGPAKAVSQVLDSIRTRWSCALLLEAHQPYPKDGKTREERPYGASLWSRWPEFGIHLATNGALRHWRGARDERTWPTLLKRGGDWPWMAETAGSEVLWARIVEEVQKTGPASVRVLSMALAAPRTSIHRTIQEHQAAWDDLTEGMKPVD